MAKTKKLAFGGMGSAVKNVAAGAKPAVGAPQKQFMSDALRGGAMPAQVPQKQFMDKMLGKSPLSTTTASADALRRMPGRSPAPNTNTNEVNLLKQFRAQEDLARQNAPLKQVPSQQALPANALGYLPVGGIPAGAPRIKPMPVNPINTTSGSDFKQGSGDGFSENAFKSMINKLGVSNQPTAPPSQNLTSTSPIGPRPMKKGGAVKASKMGSVKQSKPSKVSASSRGDGIAQRGKTKGRMV